MYRARKPRSWWVTPEWIAIKELQYVLELANWQRAGGKKAGTPPKPPKIPTDQDIERTSAEDMLAKRKEAAAHLKRRRAEDKKVR